MQKTHAAQLILCLRRSCVCKQLAGGIDPVHIIAKTAVRALDRFPETSEVWELLRERQVAVARWKLEIVEYANASCGHAPSTGGQ